MPAYRFGLGLIGLVCREDQTNVVRLDLGFVRGRISRLMEVEGSFGQLGEIAKRRGRQVRM